MTLFHSPLEHVAASELQRVLALCGYSPIELIASGAGTKISAGTAALAGAILSDARADVRFQSWVRRIERNADGVRLEMADGSVVKARAAIVTAPLNTLKDITFTPALSAAKQLGHSRASSGCRCKTVYRRGGRYGPLSILAGPDAPITWMATQHHGTDGSLLIAFGPDPARINPLDKTSVQTVLNACLPGVTVRGASAGTGITILSRRARGAYCRRVARGRSCRPWRRPKGVWHSPAAIQRKAGGRSSTAPSRAAIAPRVTLPSC
ncbi:MAG: FAD-dependent oxidoreductase [Pseudomonadales bacterium]